MFARALQRLFGRSTKGSGLTREEMERGDVEFGDTDSLFDHERLMVENGNVVGKTATITDGTITEIEGNLPAMYMIYLCSANNSPGHYHLSTRMTPTFSSQESVQVYSSESREQAPEPYSQLALPFSLLPQFSSRLAITLSVLKNPEFVSCYQYQALKLSTLAGCSKDRLSIAR